MDENQRTLLIKKLIYKSNNRGCKETDLLLGNFSKKHLKQMTVKELREFDHFLSQIDQDIWDWVNRRGTPPSHVSSLLLERISTEFFERLNAV